VRCRGPRAASSEAESRPRGRRVPRARRRFVRGVALGPRATRRLTRGGVRPSSEAEIWWCSTRSSSETEIHPRGAVVDRLVGRCGFLGRGPFFVPSYGYAERVLGFVGMFVCVLLFFERGVSLAIRGPLWLSSTTVAILNHCCLPHPNPPTGCPLAPHRRRPRHPSSPPPATTVGPTAAPKPSFQGHRIPIRW
jgi:hypothetical protein